MIITRDEVNKNVKKFTVTYQLLAEFSMLFSIFCKQIYEKI